MAGKTAVVTGGAGCMGRAMAKGLVRQGATVVITDLRLEQLQQAATEIQEATAGAAKQGSVVPMAADVTVEESVVALFKKVADECGACYLLVNCAGIMLGGPTAELPGDTFWKVMTVNVLGTFLCAREAFKQMKEAGGGRIINIGSIAVDRPRADAAPYTTSKHAVAGLTRSLALDGRPHNICVSIIHPGNVESPLMSPEEAERRRVAEGFIPAEDVATCAVQMAVMPLSSNVLELTVMPSKQPLVGRG